MKNAVYQEVNRAVALSPGMSKEQVTKVMGGPPAKAEFSRGVEEWHYCKTGRGPVDQFVALFFHNGELIETPNYSVTSADVGNTYGSCENFIKRGNYKEPDRIIELRLKG